MDRRLLFCPKIGSHCIKRRKPGLHRFRMLSMIGMVMTSMVKRKNSKNRKENERNKKKHSLQNISSSAKFAITTVYSRPEA
jgi:hypothetical protein